MIRTLICAATFSLVAAAVANASDLRFAFARDVAVQPKGMLEYEQWVTFKDYDNRQRFEFRHELEYGLTESTQLGIYLSDWRHTTNDNGADETEWRTAGLEIIHQLSNPTTDVLGSALYGEVLLGPEKFELEAKVLLQKNVGPLAFLYNFVLEAEWEGESLKNLDERVGVNENLFGISYQISPNFLIGAEAMHAVEFEDWQDAGDHVFYAGPNFSIRGKNFFVTTAALFQATDVDGEPETQIRVKAGFSF
jgi:hypothetical protein